MPAKKAPEKVPVPESESEDEYVNESDLSESGSSTGSCTEDEEPSPPPKKVPAKKAAAPKVPANTPLKEAPPIKRNVKSKEPKEPKEKKEPSAPMPKVVVGGTLSVYCLKCQAMKEGTVKEFATTKKGGRMCRVNCDTCGRNIARMLKADA